MHGASSCATLTYELLRAFLDNKAAESNKSVTLEVLDDLVRKELRMEMDEISATSRM